VSQYLFGVHRGEAARLKPRVRKVFERVARKHGVTLVEAILPGTGYQRWFAGPNLGAPFDRALERAVYADITAELGGGAL
jgi:hypothetical protein